MKTRKGIHKNTAPRCQDIICAALECFTEMGITDTSISEICRRSGASVGSVYHHFKSKEQLAAAVYLEGVQNYQAGFIRELKRHKVARDGILAIVNYHLKWVKRNPDWARFLFQKRRVELTGALREEFKQMNTEFFKLVSEWFKKHIEMKTLRSLPLDIYPSILLGPSQEFSRFYLAGHTCTSIEKAAKEFGLAAWRSVKMDTE